MKQKTFKNIAFLLILLISGCFNHAGKKTDAPKNIIIFIGDGMGVGQLYAGMTVHGQRFNIEDFPYAGFIKTYSADNYVTDSGAAGTAIACGVKTNNGMIGVTPDGAPVSSITETANKNGLATGVVSTCVVTHATPASFVAHNARRSNAEEIASDFLKGTIDVFIGGGENHFRNRRDGQDLAIGLKEQGFDVVYTMDDLKKSTSAKIAGLLAKGDMPKAHEGRQGMLKDMTLKAIETLSKNPKGFVLMVSIAFRVISFSIPCLPALARGISPFASKPAIFVDVDFFRSSIV
jgi:alkaline phosphatase